MLPNGSSRAIRLLQSTLVVVVVLAPKVVADRVQAGGILWCKADPIVSLDGRLVDITVSIPLDYLVRVNGPTQIQIETPSDVNRFVVLNDLGFNLQGSEVTFVDGGVSTDDSFPIEIRVTVPMNLMPSEVVPMEVVAWPDNAMPTTIVGTNRMTTVRISIARESIVDRTAAPLVDGLN